MVLTEQPLFTKDFTTYKKARATLLNGLRRLGYPNKAFSGLTHSTYIPPVWPELSTKRRFLEAWHWISHLQHLQFIAHVRKLWPIHLQANAPQK